MFNQPGGMANFFDILSSKKVCLENAFMSNRFSVRGTIRVQNIGFEKGVTVRYTTNEWITYTDLKADYLQGSCDGFSDKFTFDLTAPSLCVGQRLLFCLRYVTNCGEFWDNNDGPNYVFQCQSVDSSPSSGGGPSGHHRPAAAPVAVPHSHGNSNVHQTSAPFSHSPSALSEEPWLRYL
jgi:protein phosphatase 1 regulatory subunit 3A/B/C/D/E